MAWARNGTPDTLSGAGDTVTISDMSANKFNQFLAHSIESSANILMEFRFNNNSNNVYAKRHNYDGGGEGTSVNTNSVSAQLNYYGEFFWVSYFCSISGEEKLGIMFNVARNTAGAGYAPGREEYVYKFVPSPDADITRIDGINVSTGDFAAGTNLTTIGTD